MRHNLSTSMARVCGSSLAGIEGSNPIRGMDVFLSWVLFVARQRSLRRAHYSCRGVLPIERERESESESECVCVCVSLSVIQCNNNHLHLQWVGRRCRTKREKNKERNKEKRKYSLNFTTQLQSHLCPIIRLNKEGIRSKHWTVK